MIDRILKELSHYLLTENGRINYHKYEAMSGHEGWAIHQGFLVEIMNHVSSYMLSNDYTKLDKEEKDVQQRAFFMIKEIVEFLLNPMKNARRYVALRDAANKKQAKSPGRKTPEPKT